MYFDLTFVPSEYRDKKFSKYEGATGPGFICQFKGDLVSHCSLEAALIFLEKKYSNPKGLSLFVEDSNEWLVFNFGKFIKVKTTPPEAGVLIQIVE